MPLISAGDMLPAPAMLALDIKNLFGERFTLHGPSPSKERDRAARMPPGRVGSGRRSEEHTSELQSLMRTSSAGFCLTKKNSIQSRPYHNILLDHNNTHR